MKPSLLLVLVGLSWALPPSVVRPASLDSSAAAAPSPSVELNVALDRIARTVGQGRVETAWKEYAGLRESLLNAPPASEPGEGLEPALLELGRVFLLWENPEAALDAWQVAAQRGSRVAPHRMADALGKKGWPFWLHARSLESLPVRTEWLSPMPFRHAALVEEAAPTVPAAEDPLDRSRYRHSLAVYVPDLLQGRPGGTPSASNPEGKAAPVSGYVYLRFLIHFQRPEDRPLAGRLARYYAALYPLMRERLGRHTRFNENGLIHVWLVSEGLAGGEQWKEHLYFYDLNRPRSNLEWMREAAHEYGHTGLPGMSGYTEPEGWADGELGERLLLRWLAPSWKDEGRRTSDPAGVLESLGLKESGIEAYRAKYVRPLVARIAENGWQPALVAKRNAAAMDHVMGLALWAEEAHGTPFLREMLDRLPNEAPAGLWSAYHRAAADRLRPVVIDPKRKGGASKAPPLTVAPVAGRLRFYLPMGGKYRLSWAAGRKGAFSVTPQAPASGSGKGSPTMKGKLAAKPVKITPGQVWTAKPGWYRVDRPLGTLRIERA